MCSRVLVINNGMMVANDSPQALAARKPGGLEEVFISLANNHEAGVR